MVSVIILADSDISPLLNQIAEQADDYEIILVRSSEAAQMYGEHVKRISCPDATRGEQRNAGAAAASGDILLFLPPDCVLPGNAFDAILHNFELLPVAIGGNFHVHFDEESWSSRVLARLLKQWRYQGYYYGNSGLFVKTEVFNELGGFKPYPILEGYEFARRMEQYGLTVFLPDVLTVSARPFKGRKLRAAFGWLVIHMLYRVGVSPAKLAPWA